MYFWCLMIEMVPVTLLPSYSIPRGWGTQVCLGWVCATWVFKFDTKN